MSPIDTSGATFVAHADVFDRWLAAHAAAAPEAVVTIHNKASGRQTVKLVDLQQVAMRHGWVDTQTKRIDAERYAVRFVPRRPNSHWSLKNRRMARELVASGQMTEAGRASLPDDL
jgi:uncharacterized protein YdeI (YjbR/CyaY-like superfamily)